MLTWKGLLVAFVCLLCGALPADAKIKGWKALKASKAAVQSVQHGFLPAGAKVKRSKALKASRVAAQAKVKGSKALKASKVAVQAKVKGWKALKASKAAVQAMHHGIASVYSHALTTKGGGSDHTMTAAHRTFPFGTRVKVTNLTNGRVVIVRINDRGPFIKGRVIDLNTAAARVLGISGLARVSLTRV